MQGLERSFSASKNREPSSWGGGQEINWKQVLPVPGGPVITIMITIAEQLAVCCADCCEQDSI